MFPIGEQIQERMGRAALYMDLPRGRKRRGWREAFLNSLIEAARDIGETRGISRMNNYLRNRDKGGTDG